MTEIDLFISGCNRPTGYFATSNSPGIRLVRLDTDTGQHRVLANFGGIENPTFAIASPDLTHIYATTEMPRWPEGAVTAFAIAPDRGAITPLSSQSSAGSITAHLSLDRSGRFLLVANHANDEDFGGREEAVAVLALKPDGDIGDIVATAAQSGSGPQLPRQQRSHPHAVLATADNRHLIVTDLGADALFVYPFNADTGALGPARTVALTPGTGPRHMAFSHGGTLLHVCGEIDSSVTTLRVGPGAEPEIVGRCGTLPPGASGTNHPSEIALAPTGEHLYVANRGHDSIARIAIGKDGVPRLEECTPCGGTTPRHFACDSTGRYLAIANQDSDEVVVLAIGEDAALGGTVATIGIGTPTCVGFLQQGS
ncbi:lactonase family protein [Oricola thermophila]|uniref:Lactonase family protein n=1 Tax=Oricola thermophila TaxID=2742145 RepID=A0A6N1VJJ3_9HYPH|nr:lactonase family protein [Oricola thermophila]QKV19087.1 lactonase family protein [Oricola thermophila]